MVLIVTVVPRVVCRPSPEDGVSTSSGRVEGSQCDLGSIALEVSVYPLNCLVGCSSMILLQIPPPAQFILMQLEQSLCFDVPGASLK